MSEKRHFTVVEGNKEHGLFVGRTPSSVAKKVVSKLSKGKKVVFELREITQGSKKKVYGPYEGIKKKLKEPRKVGDRVYKYESEVKKIEKKGGANVGETVIRKEYTYVNRNGSVVKNEFGNDKVYILIGPKDGKYIRIQKVAKNQDETTVLPEGEAAKIIGEYANMFEHGMVKVKAGPYKLTESDVILLNSSSVGGRPVRIPINPKHHALTDHGYSHPQNMTLSARHRALRAALSFLQGKYGPDEGFLKLIHQMTAAEVLLKSTDPIESRTIKTDLKWVSKMYERYKQKGGIMGIGLGQGGETIPFEAIENEGVFKVKFIKKGKFGFRSDTNQSEFQVIIEKNNSPYAKSDFILANQLDNLKRFLNPLSLQNLEALKTKIEIDTRFKDIVPTLSSLILDRKLYNSTVAYLKEISKDRYGGWVSNLKTIENNIVNYLEKTINEHYSNWQFNNQYGQNPAPKLGDYANKLANLAKYKFSYDFITGIKNYGNNGTPFIRINIEPTGGQHENIIIQPEEYQFSNMANGRPFYGHFENVNNLFSNNKVIKYFSDSEMQRRLYEYLRNNMQNIITGINESPVQQEYKNGLINLLQTFASRIKPANAY